MFPWEKHSYENTYYPSSRERKYGRGISYPYQVVTEYLDDNYTMVLRKGDIVIFSDGLIHKNFSDWRTWFLTKEDQVKNFPKDPKVPYYARNQLAMVIGRYRKIKYKYSTFKDYGVVLMFISGKAIGHVRHFYGCGFNRPVSVISKFPKLPNSKKLLNLFPNELLEIYKDKYIDSNESRNLLVSRVFHRFQEGLKCQ
jgi:hypothetical protein